MMSFMTGLQKIPILFDFNILSPEPQSWSKVMKEFNVDNWYKAICRELESLDKKGMYNMIPKSQAEKKRILLLKQMFKYKFNINDALLKYKIYIYI